MFPDLIAVLMEDSLNERMVGVDVDFACTEDVSIYLLYMATIIEDIKTIIA